ncbi:hypothetical protein MHU86_2834 [Fragilaria crotonensis]|nr:hypothetical protein MHU86_2834 [Fragilaria crotonensis]
MSLSNPDFVKDWRMFLSSLLEGQAWLKQSRISSLMRLLKFVAPQLSGAMGNTTIKTHLVLHMDDDILNFGVPEVMNSSYAESAHISISKDTTRNTQKCQETFTLQVAMRYIENLAIRKCASSISNMSPTPMVIPGTHRLQGKRFSLEEDIDEYKSADGQIYRAHPCYHDKPWFDYALVDWHGYEDLFPARIHAFLNLCNVRTGSKIGLPHSGQEVTIPTPGFYAVIESYHEVFSDSEDGKDDSEDHEPEDKDKEDNDNNREEDQSIFWKFEFDLIPNTLQPILYLVHVDSIKRPTVAVANNFSDCVLNDDGQSIPKAKYIFMMLPQTEWSKTWDSFIHRKYREIVITKEKAESNESGDEGFSRLERIVPLSLTSRSRRKGTTSRRRRPPTGKQRGEPNLLLMPFLNMTTPIPCLTAPHLIMTPPLLPLTTAISFLTAPHPIAMPSHLIVTMPIPFLTAPHLIVMPPHLIVTMPIPFLTVPHLIVITPHLIVTMPILFSMAPHLIVMPPHLIVTMPISFLMAPHLIVTPPHLAVTMSIPFLTTPHHLLRTPTIMSLTTTLSIPLLIAHPLGIIHRLVGLSNRRQHE